MSTRDSLPRYLFPLFVFAIYLVSVTVLGPGHAIASEAGSNTVIEPPNEVPISPGGPVAAPGAPLKGVDVKLGRNPGGSVAQRTTNESGKFDFGILEEGSYSVTLSLPVSKLKLLVPPDQLVKVAFITINGAGTGPIEMAWDFEKNRAFDPATQNTAKA